jgi:hypothetical protein
MQTLIKYLKKSFDPKDSTEFVEVKEGPFNQDLFNNLKEDAFMIAEQSPPADLPNCEFIKIGNQYLIKKATKTVQWYDETTNAINFDETAESMYRRLLPTGLHDAETMNVVLVISAIINEYKKMVNANPNEPKKKIVYVEYGVLVGKVLFSIAPLIHLACGVDINPIKASYHTNVERYEMTTDKFSAKMLPVMKYHLALIDADHHADSAYRDFCNLFEYLEVGGYIFMHDTYPCVSWLLEDRFCSDAYKVPLKIKENYKGKLEILTLPLNPGLTLIRKL